MAWFRGPAPAPRAGPGRSGILIINLGTPDAPSYWAIRRFLWQFLADRRVVEASPLYWYPLLWGAVLGLRPVRTRHWYRSIWTADGSPLLANSERLMARIASATAAQGARVALAMTYGEPSCARAIGALLEGGVTRLIVLPLYPQYSGTTTGAAFDAVTRELRCWRAVPELRFIRDYHDDPAFIAALAHSVRREWDKRGARSHLLCSYHGIPERYVAAGDPYAEQARRTSEALVQALEIPAGEWSLAYQSRFGRTRWLRPSTEERLVELARGGTRSVTVIAPSFAVDCLETLEELGTRAAARFKAAGGEAFILVPALNDEPAHGDALLSLVRRHASGWADLGAA